VQLHVVLANDLVNQYPVLHTFGYYPSRIYSIRTAYLMLPCSIRVRIRASVRDTRPYARISVGRPASMHAR
jgi:hypothetical protein